MEIGILAINSKFQSNNIPIIPNLIFENYECLPQSGKPDKMYQLFETIAPGGVKIELFGRKNNVRKGWITFGMQFQ